MPGRADPRRGPAGAVLALLLLAGLILAGLPGGGAQAQDEVDNTGRAEAWAAYASDAEKIVANPDAPTEELEALRERLVAQRSEALAAEQQQQPAVDELDQRLQALGPPPAEGAVRGAGDRRSCAATCTQQIADAQAPVLAAQEAYRRTDTLIAAIDRIVRARFSAELMSARSRARSCPRPGPPRWRSSTDAWPTTAPPSGPSCSEPDTREHRRCAACRSIWR